ncbi:single-stranded DNA-binding protein [Rickettsiales bacterium LUAb2]
MAGSINKIILIGNLGKDPDIRYSQDGGKIASFSIATSESWKDKATNERKDNTQWHRIVVFNDNLSDIVEKYVKKGTKVYVEGSLQYRKYTGPDGVERNISEIVISRFRGEIHILDSRSGASEDSNYSDPYSSPANPEEKAMRASTASSNSAPKKNDNNFSNDFDNDLDDDIPF